MKHWAPVGVAAQQNLELLAEYCEDVIGRVSADLRFIYISPSCKRVLLRSPTEFVGRHALEFVLPEDIPAAETSARLQDVTTTITVRVVRGDGSLLWVETNSRLIDPVDGEGGERVVIMRDVSERVALENELRAMAMKDGLTGLANRRAFDEALTTEWKRTVRDKSQMSLLLIDIDDFKKFNDAHGHQVGDDCLRSVGAALQSACGPSDLAARYGGEELAIILPGQDTTAATIMAERVRAAVESLAIPHGPSVGGNVTISVGAATALARDGGSAEMQHSLLVSADKALYMAKAAGRNCWRSSLLLASAELTRASD